MKAPALPPLLLVNDLRFAFGRREVLRIERLEIPASGILALQGDNGSGKTTLLKLLSGLLVASGGAWQMGTKDLSPRDAARFCRGRHVYLHQAPYLFDSSVRDNISYGLARRGLNTAERRTAVAEALRWAGLEHLAERPASALSSGEKQRVALTRAWILRPRLLLLDEITSNMDQHSRGRTLELLQELSSGGAAIVIATHDREILNTLGDRHLSLVAGALTPVVPGRPA